MTSALDIAAEPSTDTPAHYWRSCLRTAVPVSVVAIALWTLGSFFAFPLITGDHAWFTPPDAWTTLASTQWINSGAFGTFYEANIGYLALPGYALLCTPVAAIIDHMHVTTSVGFSLARPQAWYIWGPWLWLSGVVSIFGVEYLLQTLRLRRRGILWGVGLLFIVPTIGMAGHPEDCLALAFVCVSTALVKQRRPLGAGLVLMFAILMQTWAVLAVPIILAFIPRNQRMAVLFRIAFLPVCMALLLLGLNWHQASIMMLKQPAYGKGQHLWWWLIAPHIRVPQFVGPPALARVGSYSRWIAVAVTMWLGWKYRTNGRPRILVWALGVALLARGLVEVEVWPYYVGAGVAVLWVAAAYSIQSGRRRWMCYFAGLVAYGASAGVYTRVHYNIFLMSALIIGAGIVTAVAAYPNQSDGPIDETTPSSEVAQTSSPPPEVMTDMA